MPQTPLFIDTFQRANENPLNPATWSQQGFPFPFAISSDICVIGNTGSAFGFEAPLIAGSWPTWLYSKVTIQSLDTSAGSQADEIRLYALNAAPLTGYIGSLLFASGVYSVSILRSASVIAGPFTLPGVSVGDTLYFECNATANTQVLQYNGVQVLSSNDATYTSFITPGLFIADNTTHASSISYYEAGQVTPTPPPPSHYSVPDCRDYGNFPNDSVDVNGTLTYTVPSVDSRAAGAPVDSRAAGAPVACGTYPQNSRTPGTFGPGE